MTKFSTTVTTPALWISIWFLLSNIIVAWDASYLFFRPRSMKGGDLSWIWNFWGADKGYSLYQTIDLVYSTEHFEASEGFPTAQATMNIVEIMINFMYLYSRHVQRSPAAPIYGIVGATMTWSKTVLYGLLDFYCGPNGWCTTGHNDLKTWILLYFLPNINWIWIPFIVTLSLGKYLANELRFADSARATRKSL